MALTVTDDVGDISSKGGSVFKAQARTSAGANLSSPDTVHDFGDVASSTFKDKTPREARYNEAGEKKKSELGNRDTGFTVNLMQRGLKVIDSIRNETRSAYFLSLRKMSESNALTGGTQWSFAFGQINPDVEFSLPGGEIPCTFEGYILETAITLTPGELTSWAGNTTTFPATITIPAGDWCKIVEVTT